MAISALIVPVPEAEPVVGSLRMRHDETVKLGVPAHITILVPFMQPELIDVDVLAKLQAAVSSVRAFSYQLADVRRWPEVTYLAPTYEHSFVRLTETVVAAFPEYRPYEGRHDRIVPHLTVAHGSAADTESAERELRLRLDEYGPLTAACAVVELIENSTGRWRRMHVMPLAVHDA